MMKKIVYLAAFSTLALMGCDAKADSQEAVVGNPGSANTMILEQGYIVETNKPVNTPAVPAPDMNAPANNQMQPNVTPPAPMQPGTAEGAAIIDTVTETQTPGTISFEEDEAVMPMQ